MLLRINVDGYRSLSKFSLDLHSGLNILIGPNGSGKTNIISFFQFISRLTETTLPNAISQMGGVGAFFTKEGERNYKKQITIEMVGETDLEVTEDSSLRGYLNEHNSHYVLSFKINASNDFTSIFFSEQSYKVRIKSDESHMATYSANQVLEITDWDLEINAISKSYDKVETNVVSLSSKLQGLIGPMFGMKDINSKDESETFKNFVRAFISADSLFMGGNTRYIPAFSNITNDIKSGEVFNIIPSKIKESEDISKPFGVNSDGSGLGATLYHIKKNASNYRRQDLLSNLSRSGRRRNSTEQNYTNIFKQIVNQLKLVNSSVKDIIVESEPFENTIKVRIKIDSNGAASELPLNLMSDGTLKWLALTTALVTSGSIFAIEEPENYLHPLMQREILSFIRDKNSLSKTKSFVIMSTHSETLLNAARPEECVIVNMDHGYTITKRPEYPLELEQLISSTGFGLGQMYISGSLDYV